MSKLTKTMNMVEAQPERRRVPRIRFKALSLITETNSSRIVRGQTGALSRLGCFVQTKKPLPEGSRIQIEIADAGYIFTATGRVGYVTGDGMGIIFSSLESDNREILANWLARTPRRFDRYNVDATAEVEELGAWGQGLITRGLSTGGCFIKTAVPLPNGSRVRLRIEHAGIEFTAVGKVTNHVSAEGMGVEFTEMIPKDRAILQKWLDDEKRTRPTRILWSVGSPSHSPRT